MATTRDIEAALRNALPAQFQGAISELALLLAQVSAGVLAPDDVAERMAALPMFKPLLHALSGQQLTIPGAILSFGQDNQLGDIRIEDIAGGDIVKVSVGGITAGSYAEQVLAAEPGSSLNGVIQIAQQTNLYVGLEKSDRLPWRPELSMAQPSQNEPIPCPYPGMVPFGTENAHTYFGRTREIDEVLRRLRYQSMLFVIGPSGSGKSSLIFAGIIPALQKRQRSLWHVITMRPGTTPLNTFTRSLEIAFDSAISDLNSLSIQIDTLLGQHAPAQRLLLIVDQLEELFSQTSRPEQAVFINVLLALNERKALTLIFTVRADFYEELMASAFWPIPPSQRIEIASLRGAELRDAIVKPAEQCGVAIEPGLIERLMADAADEPGVLPLIQETMVLLWEQMSEPCLTLNTYKRLGDEGHSGLAMALAVKADATIDGLTLHQQALARRIFLRLIQFGEGRPDTRRQQPLSALWSIEDDQRDFVSVIHYLADNRLLTLSGKHPGERQADISHEALIRAWPTLQTWLRTWRDGERMRRRLEMKVSEWIRLGQGDGGLLDVVELSETEQWMLSTEAAEIGLSPVLLDMIQASRGALAEMEQEKWDYWTKNTKASLAELAHDVNEELGNIQRSLYWLRHELGELHTVNLERISESVLRIRDIANAAFRTSSEPYDLNGWLRTTVQEYFQFRNEQEIRVKFVLCNDPVPVTASSLLLEKVIGRILRNALKFRAHTITVTSSVSHQQVQVQISNDGEDIPQEVRRLLFVEAIRPSEGVPLYEGSGRGMLLARWMMESMNGTIALVSLPGEVVTFGFWLPLADPKEPDDDGIKKRIAT